ncbi:S41 family peptidase [Roseivirga sp.]|uniref:S41 family peptidase n=1 Tax=Roseivirga sp. TaxID=1964215 RepID=UPI003B8B67C6
MKQQYSKFKLLLLTLSVFMFNAGGFAQSDFDVQAMQEDFSVFKNSIQDIHPGLYWYSDSTEVAERFSKIESSISPSLSKKEFYALLQEFYAAINCGHSWMETPAFWRNTFKSNPYTLPVNIYFEDSAFTVIHDLTPNRSIPAGSTITQINGEPLQEVYDGLLKYAPSDGFNLTKRRSFVAWNFSRFYQTFNTPTNTFEIEFIAPNTQQVERITVKGLTEAEHKALQKERYPKKTGGSNTPLASFKMIEDTGYLDINTFARGWLKSNKIKYKKLLKETFKSLKENNVEKLILDLRGNGGGSDVFGAILCQYLLNEDFKYFDRMETVTSKFKYKDYSNTKWFNTIGVLFKKDKKKPGYFTFNYHKPLGKQKPRKHSFEGELVILTDGNTFSTSADVAAVLHFNKRGTFIGREVGGGYYGNNSALQYQITLPNSKVTYYIPVVRYYSSVSNADFYGHGVKPDIVVKKTYDDYILGKDLAMEKAIDFLNR